MNETSQKPESGGVAAAIDPVVPVPVPTPVPTPTVTHYQLLADDFLKALDTLAATLPGFDGQHDTTVKFVRTNLSTPLKFLATVVAAVEQTASLTAVNKFDVTTGRDTLQFLDAFATVRDKVNTFAQALQFTMNSRRAALTASSLRMYAITKGVARDPGEALGAFMHLENMSRDLGRSKPKSKVKSAPHTPAPNPPVTPTPTPAPHQPAAPVTPVTAVAT
jgi:hypothetical protein